MKYKKRKKSTRTPLGSYGTPEGGFTLMELLVVIAIIGVISTMLVVNWRKNEKQYQLQRGAQEIVQNIRRAQDMALNSLEYQEEIPNYSYGVFFDSNNNDSYIIFGDRNGNNTYQASDMEVESVLIESGIEINSLSSGAQDLHVTFSLPDGFTNIEPTADSATIVIKKTGKTCPSNDCKSIIIKRTGQVTVD